MNTELRLIGRDLRGSNGFTMCTIVRDELFLISDFLNHYRTLGVERFIFLDDRSQDGTRELLLAEPDVMVFESSLRYGDFIPASKHVRPYRQAHRAGCFWISQLMDIAGHGRVHTMADVDEFVILPDGMTLRDAAAVCRGDSTRGAIIGVMLDVYPRHPHELEDIPSIANGNWYFDALPHIRLRQNKRPRIIYGGARARLYSEARILPVQPLRERFKNMFRKRFISTRLYNIYKPIIVHWQRGDGYLNPHNTIRTVKGGYNQKVMVPIVHYKFSPPIHVKIQRAITEKNYHRKSEDYVRMDTLMNRIRLDSKGFIGQDSRPVTGWTGFEQSGNAFGLGNKP